MMTPATLPVGTLPLMACASGGASLPFAACAAPSGFETSSFENGLADDLACACVSSARMAPVCIAARAARMDYCWGRDAKIVARHRARIARVRERMRTQGIFPKPDPMKDTVHHLTLADVWVRAGGDEDLVEDWLDAMPF